MDPRFSRRLEWSRGENALAHAERVLRAERTSAAQSESILDLTESNPTRVGLDSPAQAQALADAFRRAAAAPYTPQPRGERQAREAVADAYVTAAQDRGGHTSGGLLVKDHLVERLLLTASSSESYSYLWKLLCDPGDTVLVPEPSYPLFDYLARLEGVFTRPYRLAHDGTRGGTWQLDLASVDEAIARAPGRVAALVVVSPNNPTGTVLRLDELEQLDRRAAAAGFALVADEVFADYVTRPDPARVTFLAGQSTAALTFSLGGLSKSCGLPQLKLGWMAVGGPPLVAQAALSALDLIADTYLSVGTPVQIALPEIMRVGADRRRSIRARLAENWRCLTDLMDTESPLSILSADGGWCAVVRLPAVQTDEEWALTLLTEDGVLTHPGYYFDLRGATYLVLSLLPPPQIFAAGVRKIAARVAQRLG